MKNPTEQVRKSAERLRKARALCESSEKLLQHEVSELVSQNHGGMRDWARKVGISAQYACDLVHGRRKVSDQIVAKILETEGEYPG